MILLTKEEQRLVIFVGAALASGVLLTAVFAASPPLEKIISGADAYCVSKVSINRAGLAELLTVPGIGELTARRIIEYRETRGRFESVEQLSVVPGLKGGERRKIKKYLRL